VFVVGQKCFDLNPNGNDVPAAIRDYIIQPGHEEQHEGMVVQHFEKWKQFVEYVQSQRILLIGVEIHVDAKFIDHYFEVSLHHDLAFLMGNEGQGLSDKQMTVCDGFVRIPQYGNGTASLNVNVAASIILQRMYQYRQEHQQHQQQR